MPPRAMNQTARRQKTISFGCLESDMETVTRRRALRELCRKFIFDLLAGQKKYNSGDIAEEVVKARETGWAGGG